MDDIQNINIHGILRDGMPDQIYLNGELYTKGDENIQELLDRIESLETSLYEKDQD